MNHYLWELIILLTSWAQRDKTLQEKVTFTDKKKLAQNYSDPGGTLEKLHNLTPLISRNEELYISKEVENQYTRHDHSVWKKRQNFTFARSKRFSPKFNLPVRENNFEEQAAFWHKVKVVSCLPNPPFLHHESTIYYYWSIEHCLLFLLLLLFKSYFCFISVFVHFSLFKKKCPWTRTMTGGPCFVLTPSNNWAQGPD